MVNFKKSTRVGLFLFLATAVISFLGSIISSAWFLLIFRGAIAASGGDSVGFPFTMYSAHGDSGWDCSFLRICGTIFYPLGILGNVLFIFGIPAVFFLFMRMKEENN